VKRLLLVRHAHARSNEGGLVSCLPPGEGLSEQGLAEARALRDALRDEPVHLGVASELVRTRQTLDIALEGRDVPRLTLPGWNEIDFGSFEGGPLAAYREWAWTHEAGAGCPGDGETRGEAARRIAGVLVALGARAEETVLAVGHALPIRYVLDAADGRVPTARIAPVAHATPYRLEAAAVAAAARLLERWADAPEFASEAQP
jgi:probable phosphoglycerate mutase